MDDICKELNDLSKSLQSSNLSVISVLPFVVKAVRRINDNFVERATNVPPRTNSLKEFYSHYLNDLNAL